MKKHIILSSLAVAALTSACQQADTTNNSANAAAEYNTANFAHQF